jgi:hypothetical protein
MRQGSKSKARKHELTKDERMAEAREQRRVKEQKRAGRICEETKQGEGAPAGKREQARNKGTRRTQRRARKKKKGSLTPVFRIHIAFSRIRIQEKSYFGSWSWIRIQIKEKCQESFKNIVSKQPGQHSKLFVLYLFSKLCHILL